MFGYILANASALSEEQLQRYRGCYCGLCRALRERHGGLSRLTLNFDMTFLVMLLSSMYEPEEASGEKRCLAHPMHRRGYWRTTFTDYAADMNVALAYHNCMDNWNDDRSVLSLTEAKALKKHYDAIAQRWPRQCAAMEECMSTLADIESRSGSEPDAATNCFGRLMGEIFACVDSDGVWAETFRRFGQALGRFIYMMDACVDLKGDIRHGRYNPLIAMGNADISEEGKIDILKMLIGECTIEFERLPIVQDVDIMRNILYSGVWTQYALAKKKRKGDEQDDK